MIPARVHRAWSPAAWLGVAAAAIYLLGLCLTLTSTSYNVGGMLVTLPLVTLGPLPVLRKLTQRHFDPGTARLIHYGFLCKIAAAFPRYGMIYGLYGGRGDAAEYDAFGVRLAESFRRLDFVVDVGRPLVGTGWIRVVAGVVYALIGPSRLGGFLVFSLMGFAGMYLFLRAASIAAPNLDHRRYAKLVLFFPSLVFWPSSIGKDAWMLLTLGVSAYGVALLLSRRRGAFLVTGLGLLATSMVRPHVTLLVFVGMAVAYLLRRSPTASGAGPFPKLLGIAVITVAGALLLARVEAFFGLDRVDGQSLEQVLNTTSTRSEKGGSSFEATPAVSITQAPTAIVTVLFRPFPFEAGNLQGLVASMEGLLLFGLFATGASRLRSLPRQITGQPYLAFAALYALTFTFTFSSVANFGIVSRQRAQLFPFVLLLLSLPAAPTAPTAATASGSGAALDRRSGAFPPLQPRS